MAQGARNENIHGHSGWLIPAAFLFATITAGLATFLPVWASLLIVTVVLLATAGLLAFFGMRSVNKGAPPVPQQAIDEAKLTTQALKSNGSP